MPEETVFDFEEEMDRADVARYLRTVADRLASGEDLTLSAGDESVTLSPPGRIEFEVEVERETSDAGESTGIEVEFELEWDVTAAEASGLRIE
jgi:amphi-Trp domain-containing protein